MTRLLASAKLLAKTDENALARYCRFLARYIEIELFLQANGEIQTVVGKQGETVYSDLHARRADSLAEKLLRLEIEMGLTPAARARLGNDAMARVKAEKATGKARFFKTG